MRGWYSPHRGWVLARTEIGNFLHWPNWSPRHIFPAIQYSRHKLQPFNFVGGMHLRERGEGEKGDDKEEAWTWLHSLFLFPLHSKDQSRGVPTHSQCSPTSAARTTGSQEGGHGPTSLSLSMALTGGTESLRGLVEELSALKWAVGHTFSIFAHTHTPETLVACMYKVRVWHAVINYWWFNQQVIALLNIFSPSMTDLDEVKMYTTPHFDVIYQCWLSEL